MCHETRDFYYGDPWLVWLTGYFSNAHNSFYIGITYIVWPENALRPKNLINYGFINQCILVKANFR